MTKIQVNIVTGSLGRVAANVDKWGGLFVEVDTMPGSWTENEVKKIAKVEDLDTYGINAEATNEYLLLAYWHASESFRLEPNSILYVQLASVDLTPATVVTAFHNKENQLRLFGIVLPSTEISAVAADAWDTQFDTLFDTSKQPARAVLTFDKETATGAIPDFTAGTTNQRVMVEIANDLTAGGIALSLINGTIGMCGAGGTYLGQMLALSVHQKPSWRSHPINGGGRWAELGDINGDSVEDLTEAEIDAFDTQGVTLVVRTIRLTDAFVSNSRMAIRTQDDYGIVTHGRVIDKAVVLAYDGLVTYLDGPIYIDPITGFMAPETVAKLQRAAWNAINAGMLIGKTGDAREVSPSVATGSLPLNAVYIDPTQQILVTEQLAVEIRIVPVGASKTIVINIGLATQV